MNRSQMGPLGILGGGQLGRMTAQAAASLGVDVVIGDAASRSPAARVASAEVLFPNGWNDIECLEDLARQVSTVTVENEFVDAAALETLERLGTRVLPSSATIGWVQDKLVQKQVLSQANLPVPPFIPVSRREEIDAFGAAHGWPIMLKARRGGYDGYGNALARSSQSSGATLLKLGWPSREVYAEALVPFDRELAVIVVRSEDGTSLTYPVSETHQHPEQHVCETVLVPARVPASVAAAATSMAERAVSTVGGVGAFGVELFLEKDGQLCINELAPRPHNSGHYTMEACMTSQFENHVRAVLGLPLGVTSLRADCVVMANVLGRGVALPGREEIAASLSEPGVFLHLYGKRESRQGRKMGHVTAFGMTLEDALERAVRAAGRVST